jgi:hypothetical protein
MTGRIPNFAQPVDRAGYSGTTRRSGQIKGKETTENWPWSVWLRCGLLQNQVKFTAMHRRDLLIKLSR